MAETNTSLATIQIPAAQLAELQRILDPKQFKRVQVSTLVEMKRTGVKIISDTLRETLTLSAKYAKRAVKSAVLDKKDPPSVTFSIPDRRVPVVGYKHSATKRGGVRYTARVSGGKTVHLPYSFKSRVIGALPTGVTSGGVGFEGGAGSEGAGGHTGIFVRRKQLSVNSGKSHAKRPYDRKRAQKLGPRGVAHRLPIREVFGPSVFRVLTTAGQFSEVGKVVYGRLQDKYLERLASKAEAMLAGVFK
jgi:hypothetical protein